MAENLKYYAHGKLLITGEYAVLDGALALAIPTKKGQWLEVESIANSQNLVWESKDENGEIWFEADFSSELEIVTSSSTEIAQRLIDILEFCISENPTFLESLQGKKVTTTLEFNRHWGLGSSSTLLHLIGQWSGVNPYKILEQTFGGSGYDLACADAKGPILYQIKNGAPVVKQVAFNPVWKQKMHFVYLGKKQVSKGEVAKYSEMNIDRVELAKKVSELTLQILDSSSQNEFENGLLAHEKLMSDNLGYPTIKSQYFESINGTFKSLGAWGGDFVLFIGEDAEIEKIKDLGFETVISWEEMVISIHNSPKLFSF